MYELEQRHRQLRQRIEHLVEAQIAPLALEIESNSRFPQAAYDAFAAQRLFALALPKQYGGPEADATSLALMVEAISRVSPSSALLVFPSNAVLRSIALTGTPEQKKRLLGELASGDKPMAFCLTEPDHGSDAAGIQAKAVPQGEDYLVSGTKSYITLGPHAHYYMTFVRTGPRPQAGGISALLIPRDAPGLSFGPAEKKMGLHGSVTTQMFMDQVPVPKANRLWGEGEGWRVLTEVANPMRVWGAAAMALGTAQGLLDLSLEYATTTRQDGRRLMGQQAIAFNLAEMRMQVEACRSLVYRVCSMVDAGDRGPQELNVYVSMAKCFAADTALKVANLASEVMGRAMAGSDSLAGRLFCVAKAIQIFDGSNQIQRLVVSRGMAQGLN